jgi:hypothetical protein
MTGCDALRDCGTGTFRRRTSFELKARAGERSFIAKRDDRINPKCAAGWDVAGHKRDGN